MTAWVLCSKATSSVAFALLSVRACSSVCCFSHAALCSSSCCVLLAELALQIVDCSFQRPCTNPASWLEDEAQLDCTFLTGRFMQRGHDTSASENLRSRHVTARQLCMLSLLQDTCPEAVDVTIPSADGSARPHQNDLACLPHKNML